MALRPAVFAGVGLGFSVLDELQSPSKNNSSGGEIDSKGHEDDEPDRTVKGGNAEVIPLDGYPAPQLERSELVIRDRGVHLEDSPRQSRRPCLVIETLRSRKRMPE